jgi:ribosomal protein S12 methylthiotransferase
MPTTIYIESLGCARNQVDSETMAAHLTAAGCALVNDPATAEVIVVNTCSFIASAADESIDTILALAAYKTKGRCRQLIVAGCLPERYGDESVKALPEVDLFLGTGAYDQVVAAVHGELAPGSCLLPDPDTIDLTTPVRRKPSTPHAAYLKIAEGCNRTCTFCIIPKLRGRQKSRPLETLVAEAEALIADGVQEITLVAQETTAYGQDVAAGLDLAQLVSALAQLDDAIWIRFLYGHPESITPALMQAVARFDNLCPYFDIPIQHAGDAVLRRMGRRYTADAMVHLFDAIRARVPRAVLRTTVLVGFPGERDDDFRQLMDFTARVRFDHLGVFAYSDAEDLPSHGLTGHVDAVVAQKRLETLMEQQRAISEEMLIQYHGAQMQVLVEKEAEPGIYVARSAFQAPEVDGSVLIRTDQRLAAGTFRRVKVVETLDYDLIAELL